MDFSNLSDGRTEVGGCDTWRVNRGWKTVTVYGGQPPLVRSQMFGKIENMISIPYWWLLYNFSVHTSRSQICCFFSFCSWGPCLVELPNVDRQLRQLPSYDVILLSLNLDCIHATRENWICLPREIKNASGEDNIVMADLVGKHVNSIRFAIPRCRNSDVVWIICLCESIYMIFHSPNQLTLGAYEGRFNKNKHRFLCFFFPL